MSAGIATCADITAAMVLGQSWIEVPEAIAVEYVGELPFGIGGKDVILKTLGSLGRNTVAMERSVEYVGEAARHFSTDVRFTIANMTAEFGGLNGIFEADGVVAPVPGFVVGGANAGQQDLKGCPVPYPSPLPALSYLDHFCSYASNEVAINWNAPLVYVAAALGAPR